MNTCKSLALGTLSQVRTPSRSPTPPTEVVPRGNKQAGNKYTEADKDFFVKEIAYRLKLDPHLTQNELVNDHLAVKVSSVVTPLTPRHHITQQTVGIAIGSRTTASF